LPRRFTKIDELKRPDHSHLTLDDECYFLREYTPRAGFGHSETNDIILNFKKSVDRRGSPEWQYKEWAVNKIAKEFREAMGVKWISRWILVPVPPSKIKGDPQYDDRMVWMLRELTSGIPSDVRELIVQTRNVDPSHSAENRPSPTEIVRNYVIDESLSKPEPTTLAIVDDILTAGAHFKAAKMVLGSRFPESRIIGVFVARVERM
jgi:hypothetical protein